MVHIFRFLFCFWWNIIIVGRTSLIKPLYRIVGNFFSFSARIIRPTSNILSNSSTLSNLKNSFIKLSFNFFFLEMCKTFSLYLSTRKKTVGTAGYKIVDKRSHPQCKTFLLTNHKPDWMRTLHRYSINYKQIIHY